MINLYVGKAEFKMVNRKLLEDVGKYLEKYYIPEKNALENYSCASEQFDEASFKELDDNIVPCRCEKEAAVFDDDVDVEVCEFAAPQKYIETNVRHKKLHSESEYKHQTPSSVPSNRRIEDLIEHVEETFSQRLLRMIDERGMTDSQAYNKAYVDRRHFSKIRNDKNYAPSKKVILAFSVALELSMDEAKDLLNCAGFAFSRSSKTDIIIAYCLQNQIYDIFEINDLLDTYGQPLI